jgi:NAD(P)-dependent dehydrogenase (short-subunit alcohol dehydrogenase family)
MISLKNKIAIVTGSEGDIGKAIVKKLKSLGAIVYGFDKVKGDDITNPFVLEKIRNICIDKQHIDIVINNAGIADGAVKQILETDLIAPFNILDIVLPYMKKKGGSIINITSLWSELGGNMNPGYGMAKGGLKILTKCIAYDVGKYNIRANNVGFGYIKTAMTKASWKYRRTVVSDRTILKRWGKPEDVVGIIAFLCSDEASYITGQDIYVDGGFLAKGL